MVRAYAEMKGPGKAWLEFSIEELPEGGHALRQTANFRPQGLLGRLYWLAVLPFHWLLFQGDWLARGIGGGLFA